jgi:serine/threonine-protein kinase
MRLRAPLLIALAWAAPAAAQVTDAEQRADELFEQGRRLAAEGKHAEACAAFEDSQALDPAAGTLINLGDCYAKLGRTATAWSRYHLAMERAQMEKDEPRRKLAENRAAEMALRISRLRIVSAAHPQTVIALDGTPLAASELGVARPVDPGPHQVSATPPGQPSWSVRVDVPPGARITVEVPVWGKPAPREDLKREDMRPTFAIVSGAAAVGLLAVGSYFGARAISRWSEAGDHCEGGRCDARGVELAESAQSAATASTVLFSFGAVAAGGAAWLWFSSRGDRDAPASTAASVAPLDGGAAFVVRGRF